jgi:transcriptional regulator with XRE-family HTH domain
MATLGVRLRQLRREHGCTLQQVSDGSGLTPSFLSRLERGIVNISVGNLRKVAAFFGVPITYFFTEDLVPRGLVVRAAERIVNESAGVEIRRVSLLPAEAAHLSAEILRIAPGVASEAPLARASRALFYVLEGELTCSYAGQTLQLTKGDVLYQRRPAALRWSNEGSEAVVLLASLQAEER